MIERILVPVDFSESSLAALDYAVRFASIHLAATIDVLHVWEAPPGKGEAPSAPKTASVLVRGLFAKDEAELDRRIEEIVARGRVKVRRLHDEGEPVRAVVTLAREMGHDLIVMGTHGRSGGTRPYLGSVAEKVVRNAPCPVLTVGPHISSVERPRVEDAHLAV